MTVRELLNELQDEDPNRTVVVGVGDPAEPSYHRYDEVVEVELCNEDHPLNRGNLRLLVLHTA